MSSSPELCTGSNGSRLPQQQQSAAHQFLQLDVMKAAQDVCKATFMDILKKNGVSHLFIKNKNSGHDIPDDFDPVLNMAMDFIMIR